MKKSRIFLAAVAALAGNPAAAQLTSVPHSGEQSIIVTGERIKGANPPRIEMSSWRVAETPHVLVFSKGDPEELTRIASNLEKLHFLLSVLLNRVNDPDNTLKISVTLIGDKNDFDHLRLNNIRWQPGPYPKEFPNEIYYDPREDGAVMATAHADQCFLLERDAAIYTSSDLQSFSPDPLHPELTTQNLGNFAAASPPSASRCDNNPNKVSVTAEGRLYATYAQHYLLTYFPLAYPRWYVEGFGEIFSNMNASAPGVIEYGGWPDKYRQVVEKFGRYPVQRVLDGTYLHDPRWTPAFSPYTAWALAHLLFFSDEWRIPLHNYLAAVAAGENLRQAAAALGDVKKLSRQLIAYHGTKVPTERLTYPAGQFAPPVVRQLKKSEAAYVWNRLELGARVTIPDADAPDEVGAKPGELAQLRQQALATRDHWLAGLRDNASTFPNELVAQQLLAEAECRSGNADNCIAAADRALSIAHDDPVASAWKGEGLVLQAAGVAGSLQAARLAEARSTIIRANHLDPESVLPLLAYYRSYALAGEVVPDDAIDGLGKSLDEVPSAPSTRLLLGSALVARSDAHDARRILLPLADGAFDPPEKPKAIRLLSGASISAPAANGAPAN